VQVIPHILVAFWQKSPFEVFIRPDVESRSGCQIFAGLAYNARMPIAKLINLGLCAYCNERPAVNAEHVVARGFFPKPRPGGLVKVPACRECNAGRGDGASRNMSDDEEYARTFMASEAGASRHPDAKALIDGEIQRSIERSILANTGFAYMVADSIKEVQAVNEYGIHLGNAQIINVETGRIVRVLTKITRGLFYHITKRPLPLQRRVFVSSPLNIEKFKTITALFARMPSRTGWKLYGNHQTFGFSGALWGDPAVSDVSMWMLVFYRRFIFYCDTAPRDDSGKPLFDAVPIAPAT
jgi:hypothetical protein